MEIKIMKDIMAPNIEIAKENRKYFQENNIFVINVMASPGAGKTSIITAMLKSLAKSREVYVIEGDIASSIDAEKIEKMGFKTIQINTGGGCHLDANVIKEAVNSLNPVKDSVIFIENVGNLICPSAFDLGETLKVVISSVSEGDDKPYKYLSMFEYTDVVILNKTDLLPYIDFNREYFLKGIKAINKDVEIIEVSCKTGEGINELAEYFTGKFLKH